MMITQLYLQVFKVLSGHIMLSVKVTHHDKAVICRYLNYDLVTSSEVLIVLVTDKPGMTMCLVYFWSPPVKCKEYYLWPSRYVPVYLERF